MVVKILDDESEEDHLIDDEDDEVICIDWIKRWNKGFKEKVIFNVYTLACYLNKRWFEPASFLRLYWRISKVLWM